MIVNCPICLKETDIYTINLLSVCYDCWVKFTEEKKEPKKSVNYWKRNWKNE